MWLAGICSLLDLCSAIEWKDSTVPIVKDKFPARYLIPSHPIGAELSLLKFYLYVLLDMRTCGCFKRALGGSYKGLY